MNSLTQRVAVPMWLLVALFGAAAAAVVLAFPTAHGARQDAGSAPSRPTLADFAAWGESMGWEVHGGYRDRDGPAVLFLDRKANPQAEIELGLNQPGALYGVETPSEKVAKLRAAWPYHHYSQAWGRFSLAGDTAMANLLTARASFEVNMAEKNSAARHE